MNVPEKEPAEDLKQEKDQEEKDKYTKKRAIIHHSWSEEIPTIFMF
jgi:hypothetical protein